MIYLFFKILSIWAIVLINYSLCQCPTSKIGLDELSNYACSCLNGENIDILMPDESIFSAKTFYNKSSNEVSLHLGRPNFPIEINNHDLNGPNAKINKTFTLFPQNHVNFLKETSKHFPDFRLKTDLQAIFDLRQGFKDVTFYTLTLFTTRSEEKCIEAPPGNVDEKSKVSIYRGRILACVTYGAPEMSSCGKCSLPAPNLFSEKFILRAIKVNTHRDKIAEIKSEKVQIPSRFTIKLTHYNVFLRIAKCAATSKTIMKKSIAWPRASGTLTPIIIQPDEKEVTNNNNGPADDSSKDKSTSSSYKECGVPPMYRLSGSRARPPATYRIIGGQPTEPHYYPWQAAIFSDVDEFLCGGVIIYPGIILTAAHCFLNNWMPAKVKDLRVRLGKHNIKNKENSQQNRRVEKLIMHENFNKFDIDYKNDIAMLILRKPVKFNKFTINICLDLKYLASNFDSSMCYITGWGDTRENNQVLNHLKLPIVPTDICNLPKYMNNKVKEGMICAGHVRGDKDACQGDSGGPLQCFNPIDSKWYIVGIVSWGESCGQPNKLGLYTDVKYYYNWIQENIKRNSLSSEYLEPMI